MYCGILSYQFSPDVYALLRPHLSTELLRVSVPIASRDGERLLSDREGHGHKAVVYKSHFPPLRHSVITETPADTLANKPRLLQRPSSLLFMPPQQL